MVVVNRFRWFGWFVLCVGVILASYLTSSKVAAERKKLADVERQIAQTDRAIKALETEFDTRANLAQLERWNGETLKLGVPTAQQYLRGEDQLAQVDFNADAPAAIGGGGAVRTQTAALVIPSAPPPESLPQNNAPVATAQAAATRIPAAPASQGHVQAKAQPAVQTARADAVIAPRPVKAAIAAVAKAADKDRARPRAALAEAVSTARPRTVAMIDHGKLLSDTTLDDLIAGARKERSKR